MTIKKTRTRALCRAREKRPGHAGRVYRQLRLDLKLAAFVGAAYVVRLHGHLAGTMPCPLCQQTLTFWFDEFSGVLYFAARCVTPDCLDHRE